MHIRSQGQHDLAWSQQQSRDSEFVLPSINIPSPQNVRTDTFFERVAFGAGHSMMFGCCELRRWDGTRGSPLLFLWSLRNAQSDQTFRFICNYNQRGEKNSKFLRLQRRLAATKARLKGINSSNIIMQGHKLCTFATNHVLLCRAGRIDEAKHAEAKTTWARVHADPQMPEIENPPCSTPSR